MWKKKKKRAQLTVKFQAHLIKWLLKQPKECGALARFNESPLNNFANRGDGKIPRDSNNIIKLMLPDECTGLWTEKLETVKNGQEDKGTEWGIFWKNFCFLQQIELI